MQEKYFDVRTNCPSCGSKRCVELYKAKYTEPPISTYLNDFYNSQGGVEFSYLVGESFVLDECSDCGLVYQRDIPNDFLMKKLYDEWIDPAIVLGERIKTFRIDYYSRLAREIETIVKYFDLPPTELKFLDFGSGWGDWCNIARSYGCSAFGAELSQSRIDYSNKLGVPNLSWDEISMHQFDFINTEQVFEHVPNPLELLQYLVQSLKPNGMIKISVPNGGDVKRLLSIMDWNAPKGSTNSLNVIAPLEHINCFNHNSILVMTKMAKLNRVVININNEVQGRTKGLLDYSIKDLVRPIYRVFVPVKETEKMGSTYLFFIRANEH